MSKNEEHFIFLISVSKFVLEPQSIYRKKPGLLYFTLIQNVFEVKADIIQIKAVFEPK